MLLNCASIRRTVSIAVFAFACLTGARAIEWSEIVKLNAPALCRIEILSGSEILGSGSGFVIDTKGLILTNNHVVSDAINDSSLKLRLVFPQSVDPTKTYIADVKYASASVDLAVLDAHTAFTRAISISEADIPPLMTEILVMGFPLGKNFKTTPGFVQAIQNMPETGDVLDLSAAVDPGNSGGPVLDAKGRVTGVVVSKIVGLNFNFAIPAPVIRGFLDSLKNRREILVTSEPSGSLLFANGRYLGKTPFAVQYLGTEIELSLEQDGYATFTKKVGSKEATAGAYAVTMEKAASSKVSVIIETEPAGAKLWIDNTEIGTTPATYETDPGARLRIRVKGRGFREVNLTHDLGIDAKQTIKIGLKDGKLQ